MSVVCSAEIYKAYGKLSAVGLFMQVIQQGWMKRKKNPTCAHDTNICRPNYFILAPNFQNIQNLSKKQPVEDIHWNEDTFI